MRILIVDDEAPARERLQRLLSDTPDYELIGQAANGEQALQLCQQQQPDVVLLDVRMPGLSGIEVAQHLNTLDEPPAVIFTTAYDDYALDAFEAEAIGYLLKPIRKEKLARALHHAARLSLSRLQQLKNKNAASTARAHICAKLGEQLRLIPVNDIRYFVAEQKYITVHHAKGTDLIDESLKDLSAEFAEGFIRIHRNTLVAERVIAGVVRDEEGQYKVQLRDTTEMLPISRRHNTAVLRRLRGELDSE
ncbi:MAG: LytR/AlgR family response regulator transcription factor [Steroidobacteraceae bacterium]